MILSRDLSASRPLAIAMQQPWLAEQGVVTTIPAVLTPATGIKI